MVQYLCGIRFYRICVCINNNIRFYFVIIGLLILIVIPAFDFFFVVFQSLYKAIETIVIYEIRVHCIARASTYAFIIRILI